MESAERAASRPTSLTGGNRKIVNYVDCRSRAGIIWVRKGGRIEGKRKSEKL